jgi:phosphoserine phosphatase
MPTHLTLKYIQNHLKVLGQAGYLHLRVSAISNSPLDLTMLKAASEAIVLSGKEQSRSCGMEGKHNNVCCQSQPPHD